MKKFSFIFFFLTVFTVLFITISIPAQIIYTPVEFRCNMKLQMKRGAFDRGDRVFVRLNNAAPYDYELNDYDGDSVYSEIFWNFKKGQELLFIFTYEGKIHHYRETLGNRKLVVTAGANICDDYWNGVAKDPAKEIQVNFSVSMDLERLTDLFNPEIDSVFVSGNFNNWQKLHLTPRSYQPDIYEATIPINLSSEDTLHFNFSHSPEIKENVPIRNYVITFADYGTGHLGLPMARFNQAPLLTPSITVIFKCNIASQLKNGKFSPDDKVFVRGNFNDWSGTGYELTDKNGDSVYTGAFGDFTTLQQLVFKFAINHNGRDTVENINNRILTLHPDINVFERAWEEVVEVTFNCNMSVQIKRGTFNPATDSVWVRGNFNDWADKDFRLMDSDGDSIYSGLYNNFTVGQNLVFKYVHSPDVWEATGNRTLTVTSGANLTSACWEDVCVYIPSKIIKVAFSVNMELERLSGLFNPAINKVSVRGSFNGWGETLMTPSTTNADLYEVTTDVIAAVDEKINFKFFYSPGTWEVNNLTDPTHNDRYFIVTQAVFDSGFMAYDAIGFNNQSSGPYPYHQKVKIICNTNGAKILNAPIGTEFQTVHILGVPSNEFNIENYLPKDVKSIQLFDDGTHGDVVIGDKIFSVDTILTFPVWCILPQWFNISYKYSANYNLPTNGGSNDNEVIGGRYHASYFSLFDPTVIDTFGIVKITKVEQDTRIPTAYGLEQNYPNPFNPETVISWQIAVGSFVTLKVYDVLGNEVAVLVNEEQPAGTYRVTFNPQQTPPRADNQQQLSSGIYFYQLRAGDFVQTKKMILLR
jgi:hypothetical protein